MGLFLAVVKLLLRFNFEKSLHVLVYIKIMLLITEWYGRSVPNSNPKPLVPPRNYKFHLIMLIMV